MIGYIVTWLVLCFVPALIAKNRGHSAVMYFCLGFLLSPLIASIIALVVKRDEDALADSGDMKKCPKCAELVKPEAKVCRFCNYEFKNVPGQPEERQPMTPQRRAELERKMAAGKKVRA